MAVSRHGDTPDKIDNFCQAGQSRLNHKLRWWKPGGLSSPGHEFTVSELTPAIEQTGSDEPTQNWTIWAPVARRRPALVQAQNRRSVVRGGP